MNKLFLCPVCGQNLPLWYKLSSVIECKHCRSGLKINGWNRLISFLLLIPFLVGVVKVFDGNNVLIYVLLSLVSFGLIMLALLSTNFNVVYASNE